MVIIGYERVGSEGGKGMSDELILFLTIFMGAFIGNIAGQVILKMYDNYKWNRAFAPLMRSHDKIRGDNNE